MPRINIEDDLFKDQRFTDLVLALKHRDMALGALVSAWIVGQKYWKENDNGIPRSAWVKQKLRQELIDTGFAEDRGDFIYVVGSKESFAWLRESVESGKRGGKASAKSRKKVPRVAEGFEPSLSLSSSSSSSSSSSVNTSCSLSKGETEVSAPEPLKSPVGYFIANYVNAYKFRYGEKSRPILAGKIQGQIKVFLAETPLERACELIQTYCGMNDAWFLNKGHDFSTFISNLSKVSLKLDTGSNMTGQKAREIERAQTNSDNWDEAGRILQDRKGV